MRTSYPFALATLCSFTTFLTHAQIFQRQTASAIETVIGDSRSVNWADIDNDGDQDLLITNGPQLGESNFLFSNDGGTFVQVTAGPVANDNAPSDGATFGDIDNDGDIDLFVANWWDWNDMLYTNNGDGTFTEISGSPVVLDTNGTETGSWGDYDADGYLDLYAAMSDPPLNNKLYHNNGNGTFTEIATGVQCTDTRVSRCVNWTDTDLDGDMDLFVTNEQNQPENLYVNDGTGAFTALSSPLTNASAHTMSASWGDYDNDGDLDVFLANYNNTNKLFRNDGGNVFVEVLGTPMSIDDNCSFSSNWVDVDNDADLDLFVTNAYCPAPLIDFLYLNDGLGNFTKQETDVVATDTVASYGQAFADTDGDGDLDLVVANIEYGGNRYYTNNGNSNHYVRIRCVGTTSNASAIGTKVYVTAIIGGQSVTQLREITAQSGYCSQNELTTHFGLGDANSVQQVMIVWPSGLQETYSTQPTNVQLTAIEGGGLSGIAAKPVTDDASWLSVFTTNNGDSVEGLLNTPFRGSVVLTFHDMNGRELGNVPIQHTSNAPAHWKWNMPNGRLAAGTYAVRAVIKGRNISELFTIQ